MENTKHYKTKYTLFYIASVLFYVGALLSIIRDGITAAGIICLGLGSTFLCLGSVYIKKYKNNNDSTDK